MISNGTYPIEANYSFWLNVEGFEVKVTYKRSAFGDCFDAEKKRTFSNLIHFAFYGKAISSTGYRSKFTELEAMESFGGCPYEFAKLCAADLCKEVKAKYPERFNKQLNLF